MRKLWFMLRCDLMMMTIACRPNACARDCSYCDAPSWWWWWWRRWWWRWPPALPHAQAMVPIAMRRLPALTHAQVMIHTAMRLMTCFNLTFLAQVRRPKVTRANRLRRKYVPSNSQSVRAAIPLDYKSPMRIVVFSDLFPREPWSILMPQIFCLKS